MMDIHAYSFAEHRHRYASWTAARAVQRSFANTALICSAIDATRNLRTFAESDHSPNQEAYDEQHAAWCQQLIAAFSALGKPCSFGRAAKIVAIYLKTAVIIPEKGTSPRSLVIHPPIDRILLHNLCSCTGDRSLIKHGWTQFDEDQYNEVKACIKKHVSDFNWKAEVFWRVSEQPDEME